jgi:hypothetical protein
MFRIPTLIMWFSGERVGTPETSTEGVVMWRSVTATSGSFVCFPDVIIGASSTEDDGIAANNGDRNSNATRIVALLALSEVMWVNEVKFEMPCVPIASAPLLEEETNNHYETTG